MRRQIPDDYFDYGVPENTTVHQDAFIATSMAFEPFRSTCEPGLTMDAGAGLYYGSMLDVGPRGQVHIGQCALLTAPMIICDERVDIGDYALISWNVVIMDTYRAPTDPADRREMLRALSNCQRRRSGEIATATHPVKIGRNAWVGFDSIILPGVTIGEGAIVGCRSVVDRDVEPYTVVAGNPVRVIRRLQQEATV